MRNILLDGILDEPAWQRCERRKFGPAYPEDEDLRRRALEKETHMRIGYGDEALYFAFECPEPRMDLLVTNAKAHDSNAPGANIFGDDAIEIFTDTNLDLMTYIQWVFNTIETRTEGQYLNYSIFNEPWDVKVHRAPDFWNAEVSIPYKSLGATARPGDSTRF